jgi:uncharacterized protein YegJ (DUF2314 family)
MKNGLSVILIIMCLSFYSCTVKSHSEQENFVDNIAHLSSEDKNINRFKDTAQKQIDYLISFMNSHDRNDTSFEYFAKSNFKEGDINERMWCLVKEFKDGNFTGVLANDPASLKLIKAGDKVKIPKKEVEDWILNDHLTHSKVGGFSQEYLREEGK